MMHTQNTSCANGTTGEKDTLCAPSELGSNAQMPDYKNIKIHEDTHERLKSHGNMGESFDDLINRILDDWEDEDTNK